MAITTPRTSSFSRALTLLQLPAIRPGFARRLFAPTGLSSSATFKSRAPSAAAIILRRTMASTTKPDHDPSTTSTAETPALPWHGSDAATAPTELEVNGPAMRLDDLGPIVVHVDGTMSRIDNWADMSEIERKNVLRILPKRNRARLQALKDAQATAAAGVADQEKRADSSS
ncbi:hypothetical protein AMAG_15018 [Allomyces macrogynus ATCC 38327]|uniref:Uncharacterized protein n=1 Tax=Allomyces macrogynus (strain ATCC 38327) TaxID=578462 RepID=A0A0L0T8P0_ALLM3|nr:hypothetical protein AMAG_15018 [Allomyces macrogynus ATCC 38327]|eukprot:KNE70929.1 hypothetical protein AMAG_15018 [Allomyces macrogynus ATCC 38327]